MPLSARSWYFSNRINLTKKAVIPALCISVLCILLLIFSWSCLSNTKLVKGTHVRGWKNQSQFMKCQNNVYSDSFDTDWNALLASDLLTGNDLVRYFLWTNNTSCQLSHHFGGIMMSNPSGLDGQKAVCIDAKIAPQPGKCLVYSFGINNEWSFEENMSRYGCKVFAFDPSEGLEKHDHRPGNVHFYNWGLGDRDEYDNRFNWTIRSLSSIYKTLSPLYGNKIIDYLKIDIEYSEWIALPDIIASGMLSKIRQIGIEIHLDIQDSLEQHREWAKLLRSIENMGMIRFDSQLNPWAIGSFMQFSLTGSLGYEIAWYNSKLLHVLT